VSSVAPGCHAGASLRFVERQPSRLALLCRAARSALSGVFCRRRVDEVFREGSERGSRVGSVAVWEVRWVKRVGPERGLSLTARSAEVQALRMGMEQVGEARGRELVGCAVGNLLGREMGQGAVGVLAVRVKHRGREAMRVFDKTEGVGDWWSSLNASNSLPKELSSRRNFGRDRVQRRGTSQSPLP
jgi:hypothetical protein